MHLSTFAARAAHRAFVWITVLLSSVAAACGGDPVTPSPPTADTAWHAAVQGRYEGIVLYSCECSDEVQVKLTVAPPVADTLRMPSVRRTVYLDKRDLPEADFTMGRTLVFALSRYRTVSNYHALDLHHDDSLEFVCRVRPVAP